MTKDEIVKFLLDMAQNRDVLERYCPPECNSVMWTKAIREATELLKATPEWISVKDKLPPENDGMVLAIVSGKPLSNDVLEDAYELAEYTSDGWIIEMWPEWEGADVKYWMPLPEPPKGVGAE